MKSIAIIFSDIMMRINFWRADRRHPKFIEPEEVAKAMDLSITEFQMFLDGKTIFNPVWAKKFADYIKTFRDELERYPSGIYWKEIEKFCNEQSWLDASDAYDNWMAENI